MKVFLFPEPLLDLSQAVRVDMVALPDPQALPEKVEEILKEPTPPPKEPVQEKPEPAEKPTPVEAKPEKKAAAKPEADAINIKKVKDKQKAALEKLKKQSAIDKIKEDLKKENEKKPTVVFKGRVLSAGTVPTGLDKLQSENYLAQLDAHIKQHWTLPQWLIGKPFKARIHVKFDEQGKILFKKIVVSSGQPTYDEYCLKAIEDAEPFPAVPAKFAELYKVDGVQFAFPD